jgi:hypothetical protein
MENHPIPQDITGFKFKIIGSMTVKQFAYVIVAGIFCAITFALPLNGAAGIIKLPIIAGFAGLGVALAFIPVGGRPLDKMLMYFMSSIPKENQFVYHKQGVNLQNYEFFQPLKTVQVAQSTQPQKNNEKRTALASALRNSYFRPDTEELQYLTSLKASFDDSAAKVVMPNSMANEIKTVRPVTPVVQQPTPQPVAPTQIVQPVSEPRFVEQTPINPVAPVQAPISAEQVKNKIAQAPVINTAEAPAEEIKKEIEEIKTTEQTVGKTTELENRIRELEQQLAQANGQTAGFQKQVMQQAKSAPQAPVVATEKPAPAAQNVTTVTQKSQLNSGFPTLPDIPNIVLGIVKDPRGKVLQNVLVEVVDTNEIPVRAFKTNALGQFISATPLPNGVYKISFDDPGQKHEFETVQVEMKGEIFNPIEVISIDQREKLRRELFGSTPITPQPGIPVPSAIASSN